MTKTKLIQLTGLPASGKSTYLKKHFKSYVTISLDEIRSVFFGHQFHQNAEPFIIGIAKNMARILLKQGKSVVIDSTAINQQIRKDWYAVATQCDSKYEIVWFKTPVETCLKRNRKRPDGKRVPDDVILRMDMCFEPLDIYSFNDNTIKITTIE